MSDLEFSVPPLANRDELRVTLRMHKAMLGVAEELATEDGEQ